MKLAVVTAAALSLVVAPASARGPFAEVVQRVLPKIVKIYGVGGVRGLESYQSGFLVSSEGYVVTTWSYVLDPDYTTVVLDDGRKFTATFVGNDPRMEIAVLKIDAAGLDHFALADHVHLRTASRVLAFSNLFGVAAGDEPASVQHGIVSAITSLQARRGAFQSPYRGKVYVLDAMTNNAGATGGALTDRQGRLAAILGKELRNSLDNTWLNYAIPLSEAVPVIQAIISGEHHAEDGSDESAPLEAWTLEALGLVLVPDVLENTPPYVDEARPGSAAARAGLQPDDLIVYVDTVVVRSYKDVVRELARVDRTESVRLTVVRQQELIDVQLDTAP
jgi:serine protease Do